MTTVNVINPYGNFDVTVNPQTTIEQLKQQIEFTT